MEFLVLDLALALAALLGYRVLQELARGGFGAAVRVSSDTPRRATAAAGVESRARTRADRCCERGAPHRLINFW
jgi:hypothetical protein